MKEAKTWGDEKERKMDSSSVFGVVREKGGLAFETEVVKERDEASRSGRAVPR
jgi:hypothetical protein